MEQRRVGHEPLRSSQRRRSFEVFFLAVLLLMLMAFVSGPCGERGAVSSRGPRWWKAGGQARRAGAPCGPVERVWAGGEGAERPRPTPVREAQSTRFPWERAQSTRFQCPSKARGDRQDHHDPEGHQAFSFMFNQTVPIHASCCSIRSAP